MNWRATANRERGGVWLAAPPPSSVWAVRWGIGIALLVAAILLGERATTGLLVALLLALLAVLCLSQPAWGALAIIPAALLLPLEFSTGTAVSLNPVTLLVIALLGLLALTRLRQGRLQRTAANRPLLLFLLAGLLSLLVGNALWDPFVPRGPNFILVQLAQWAIFALSAGAFWLGGNLIPDEKWLRRLTFLFLMLGGLLALLWNIPGLATPLSKWITMAIIRAPFWVLLAGLAAGQLLFNQSLRLPARLGLLLILGTVAAYALVFQQDAASNWIGIAAVLFVLFWLRWPRWRWPLLLALLLLAASGLLFRGLWTFAGGDVEWELSGGSRLSLIERVVEVTLRNPITGLGPAAYRAYSHMKPLVYLHIVWVQPLVSSHNNYVDLFSHVGLLGLGLFGWFVVALARSALRLRARFQDDFRAGYVNGMLAVGAGALVLMALADWILPFVYNIGFPGFQASVLVWLFLGGLAMLSAPGEA